MEIATACSLSPEQRAHYARHRYVVVPGGVSDPVCGDIVRCLEGQNFSVISEDNQGTSKMSFYTLNGQKLLDSTPVLPALLDSVSAWLTREGDAYTLVDNLEIGASTNAMYKGQQFRRHYDRHLVSVVFMLSHAEGGDLLLWPGMKNLVGWLPKRLGRVMENLLAKIIPPVRVAPKKGTMVVFDSSTAHEVTPVTEGPVRVTMIFGFDRPEKSFRGEERYYGYTQENKALKGLAAGGKPSLEDAAFVSDN